MSQSYYSEVKMSLNMSLAKQHLVRCKSRMNIANLFQIDIYG